MIQMATKKNPKPVVSVSNRNGQSPIVVVCEHASNYMPPEFNRLGLSGLETQSHIAWDPGAKTVSSYMSEILDCPLVVSEISRLVYDCNRPPDVESAMPARSEIYDIPGNQNLSVDQRSERTEKYYEPFKDSLAEVLSEIGDDAVLVTIHSFTPIYNGEPRQVELGILHDSDSKLAELMMEQAHLLTSMNVQLNQPYGVADGVTHTLQEHGVTNKILNVMVEIRNDLLVDDSQAKRIAEMLSSLLTNALHESNSKVMSQRIGI